MARGATVGTFDGLHRGHDIVIRTLKKESSERGLYPLVLTLDRHPLQTVAPERAPGLIMSHPEKINRLKKHDIDVETIEFLPETASLSAEEWMRVLRDQYDVKLLVLGYDNTFGCDGREMHVADYLEIGKKLGMEIVIAPVEKGVSSSAIRRLLKEGNVEKASEMLGRPYSIAGIVDHGNALGREIGFPTANLKPDHPLLLPKDGVYSAVAILPTGRECDAVVNIGMRPTVSGSGKRTIEAHLIDFEGSLYGLRLMLLFKRRLRDEKKFSSVEELAAQLKQDVRTVVQEKKEEL